jgi:hypothetical protein
MTDAAHGGAFVSRRTDRSESHGLRAYGLEGEALERAISRHVGFMDVRAAWTHESRDGGKADRSRAERVVTFLCWSAWAALALLVVRVLYYLWVMGV